MKKVLFSLFAVMMVFASCGGPDPVKFNDALSKANTEITNVSTEYQDAIAKLIEDTNFSAITAQTDSALAKINKEIDIVKALEAPKGGDAFKEAAIKTYEGLRSVVETGKKFSSLTAESTDVDLENITNEYDAKIDEYSKLFDALVNAQAEYAKEAGYDVR
ncbi:copper chaperone CopZ/predicted small lipoprotein YifL [Dysgonomonas hofstadii]|uniref:Copper chaperone CopZ/predicted small lipoprotein YifL n=1 Tax=Dysgonomonas hofstadii TaxID=637886 RepID=A0A840CTY1_9BACT|nr:hypothetical protein [Dysgonomonas hofstadii]MBB4035962.1 copper chaperone CopZ/predicted small lipoprotein YifL [Dysgonomonas hofstadii]